MEGKNCVLTSDIYSSEFAWRYRKNHEYSHTR